MRRKLVAGAALAVAIVPALATAPACFPQGACSSSSAEYCAQGDTSCAGHLIDPYTWQSGPIDAPWLDYPRQRYVLMHFRDAVTNEMLQGKPYDYEAWIAPEADATAVSGQFVQTSGNLAEFSPNGDWSSVTVHNDTCADYFLYVVVRSAPDDGGAAPAQDGSADASQDTATE